MPTIVELPDKTELEFPDGMSESDMRNVISSRFPQFSKQEPGRTPLSQTPYPAKMEDVGVSGGEFENVQPVVLPPFGKPGTVTRGISKGLTGVVEFGTSPAGVALAPAMMIPGVGPVLAAGMTGGAVWQGALKASEAIEKKSPEAAGEALVMGGLGALGALGTVASIPESARLLPETTREVIKVPEAVAKLETPVTAKPAEPQPVVEPKPEPEEPVVVGYETAEGVVPEKAVVKGEAIPPPLTPTEQAEARADLAAELGEEPQAPVAPEPAPAPVTPAISAPEAKAPEVGPVELSGTKFSQHSHALVSKDPASGKWRLTVFDEFTGTGEIVPSGHEEYSSRQAALDAAKELEYTEKPSEPTPPAKVEAPPVKVGDHVITPSGYEDVMRVTDTHVYTARGEGAALHPWTMKRWKEMVKSGEVTPENAKIEAPAAKPAAPEQLPKDARTRIREKQDAVIAAAERQGLPEDVPISEAQVGAPTIADLRRSIYPEFEPSLDSISDFLKIGKKPAAETAPVAAAAKVDQKVKTVAKTEGQRSAKEVKSELVDRLERAIDVAPTESEVAAKSYTTADMKRVETPYRAEMVTIDIPGDGTFKIRNTKEALTQILQRAKKIATTSVAPTKIPRKAIESSERALEASARAKEVEAGKNVKVTQEKARGELYDAINKSEDEGISGSSQPQDDPELYPEGTMWKEWRIRKATPEERTEHWKGTKAEIRWVGERRTVKFSKAKGRTEGEWLFDDSGKTRADVVRGMESNIPGDASIQDEGLKAWRDLENMEGSYSWIKEGKAKPPETPPTGPGVPIQPTTPEARLSQSLQSVPKQKPPPQGPAAQPMGITPFPGLVTGLQKVAQSAQRVWREIADVPKFKPFKRVINQFNADTQRTSLKIRQMQADIESRVPDPKRLEAITNWLQADGDVAKLQQWEAATPNPKLRQGYRDAQHLTPYEVQVAKSIRQYYDDLLARGQAYGILDQAKDDYVTQIWKRPLLGGAQFAQFASKLSRTFKFGMKSVFENFFEGEQAGFKPMTKNISKLLGVYVSELEKTIATRDMIRNLTHETASDGNPLAKVEGTAHISEDQAGDPTGPMFVRPGVVNGDVRYAELNHPALKNWKWVSKDPESGRDVFILGELRVHPEIRRHLSNALSQSQISKWMREPSESELANILKLAARFGDTASRVIKQTMLGTLSMFHHVQEGTHAVGHRANAFLPEKLGFDATNPKNALFNYALDHGLQVAGDRISLENFREGLGSHGVFEKVPVLGKLIEKHNDLLFNEYIPRLKWDTWQRIYARNLDRYKREIAKGEITQDDVAYLSSKQTNAAFGHQNYVDLGRNATVQHVLRLFALAPDFLEARTRFAGQALQGAVSKVGREQLEALGVLGGLFFVGARVLNKLSDDDWHFEEPFRIKYGNRWYGMRSVPEDVWRAFKDTRMFAYNRLNPVFGRPLMELMSGVNYRGEKIPASEVFKNALVSGIPIQMREAPAFRNLTETQRNTTITAWEQFLSAMGIQVSRYSPLNQTYKLATKWRKAQGEKEAPTTYPVSKYQPMRYALEDRDLTKATDELIKLTEGGKVPLIKIAQGFRTSLHRPFSGTLANEPKFVASLTADQKALYKEAVAQRSRVWREFVNAEQEYHNRMKQGR